MTQNTLHCPTAVVSLRTLFSVWTAFVAATLLMTASLGAATFTWTGGGGANTLFSNPENWGETEDYPEGGDTAVFQWSGNQTVTFDDNETTTHVQFLGTMDGSTPPTLTLDLSSFTYNTTTSIATNIFFPSGANTPRTLQVQNGTLTIGGTQWWGHGGAGGSGGGEVVVRVQQGATMNVAATYLSWRNSTEASISTSFVVEDGGILNGSGLFAVGNGADHIGNVVVDGSGSELNLTGARNNQNRFYIGSGSANGNVTISDGGKIETNIEVGIGNGVRSVGNLTVTGGLFDEVESEFTPSRIIGNDMYIGGASPVGAGSTPQASGMGHASFLDGGTGQFITLRSYFNADAYFDDDLDEWVDTRGTLTIDAGHVAVTGTATLFAGSVTELGVRTVAQDVLMTVNNLILDSTLQLLIAGDFVAAMNDEIHLIQYTSLTGTFAGLSEGATIHHDGHSFTIHYEMGTGGDIIGLTVIPEPATVTLLAGMLAALLLLQRRKRIHER